MPASASQRENARLQRLYGISLQHYEDMSYAQHGVCAICHEPNQMGHKLCVDHSHATHQVRGLLCHRCNTAIGKLSDNVTTLRNAVTYLQRFL